MKSFCENYNFTYLIKQASCYKNPISATYVDLILSKVPGSLQSTCVIETRLSDFHIMTLTALKKIFKKSNPGLKIIGVKKTFQVKSLGSVC